MTTTDETFKATARRELRTNEALTLLVKHQRTNRDKAMCLKITQDEYFQIKALMTYLSITSFPDLISYFLLKNQNLVDDAINTTSYDNFF